MKVTGALILCLKCICEEMWMKTDNLNNNKCYVFKKVKLIHRISLSLVYVHCLNLLEYSLCQLLS